MVENNRWCLLTGVSWVDMHKLANKVMLTSMTDSGILSGSVDDMMKVRSKPLLETYKLFI